MVSSESCIGELGVVYLGAQKWPILGKIGNVMLGVGPMNKVRRGGGVW